MRVCHLITNPYTFDTRVRKECVTLREMGCDVAVVGVRGRGLPARERDDGVAVTRVHPAGVVPSLGRLGGKVLRDRLGGSRWWPLIGFGLGACTRTARFGRDVVRQTRRSVRAIARPFVRIARRLLGRAEGPIDLSAGLREALRTEVRLPLRAHLTWWLGLLLALVLLPLAPLAIVLAMLLLLTRGFLKLLKTYGGAGVRRLLRRVRLAWAKSVRPIRLTVFRTARALAMVEAAYRVDANVYQANDYDTLAATWFVARLRGVPFVYDIHELYDESFPTRKPFRTRYWIRLVEGRLARRALRTITVGAEIARVLSRRYRMTPPVVVRNAQPFEGVPVPVPLLREAIGDSAAGPRRVLFVYAGRIALGRGLMEAVAAMSRLDPSAAALVVMGNGDRQQMEELRREISRLGVEDQAYVLPAIPADELPSVLADADVGLMLTQPACLSYYYGLGNKLFHYVNAGIPVLVPTQPEKQRFVERHGVGRCVADLTPAGIADAMQRFIDDPGRTEVFKRRCRDVAPSVAWEHEAKRYEAVYVAAYEHILFDRPRPSARKRPAGESSVAWSPA